MEYRKTQAEGSGIAESVKLQYDWCGAGGVRHARFRGVGSVD